MNRSKKLRIPFVILAGVLTGGAATLASGEAIEASSFCQSLVPGEFILEAKEIFITL